MASGGEEDEHGEQVCFVAPCCPHGSLQPPGRRWPLSVSSLGEDGAVLTPPEHWLLLAFPPLGIPSMKGETQGQGDLAVLRDHRVLPLTCACLHPHIHGFSPELFLHPWSSSPQPHPLLAEVCSVAVRCCGRDMLTALILAHEIIAFKSPLWEESQTVFFSLTEKVMVWWDA